ncbi:MAG: hypothetical protein MJ074_04245 [Oscillospiraceae bacterium]|nr:hypothetical protein [Oscillospiraceae bacterium]
MMRMKKLLSLLLAVLLAVSLLPTAAFAAEYNDGDEGGVQMALTVEGPIRYTVTVSASPENYGTVTGGGTYDEGASVTVTAAANAGYIFTGWLENGEKVENVGASYTFTASADRTLTAVFVQGDGDFCHLDITSTPYFNIVGVDTDGPMLFRRGEMLTITAVPKHAGVKFSGWWKRDYDPANPDPGKTLVSMDASYSFNIEERTILIIEYKTVQTAYIEPGESSDSFFGANSLYANEPNQGDYVPYTSDDPDDLKFHFPPADCFTAPEGKVFDCWEMNGIGYEAGAVQTVIGDGANPAFASNEITITAKWKNDDSKTLKCVISIPAQIEIPYKQEFTSVPWSVDSLELGIYQQAAVTFYDGTFLSQEGGIIPYTLKDIAEAEDTHSYTYKLRKPEEHTIQVHIAAEDWDIAAPGRYTATMRFEIEGID